MLMTTIFFSCDATESPKAELMEKTLLEMSEVHEYKIFYRQLFITYMFFF